VKHDPSGLPLSKGVRYTENTAEIHIGEGLWVGASEGPTTFKIYAVDPASQQVGFYGVMKEWDRPLILALHRAAQQDPRVRVAGPGTGHRGGQRQPRLQA
jgi:hypothetical protein